MATVILVRHGRTTANADGVLAGRTPGISLDDTGRRQVAHAGQRLATVPLVGVISSPLERCRETSRVILDHQPGAHHAPGSPRPPTFETDGGITECDYGDWQNRKLTDLAKEELWATVLARPSFVTFPGGESMLSMQNRAVSTISRYDRAFESEFDSNAVWAAVCHGDIIKSIVADAFGMPFDHFQRVHADPASVSVIRYPALNAPSESAPRVFTVNSSDGDLSWLRPATTDGEAGSDGASAPVGTDQVGGGAGH
jgi:probable phosphomutase (TIGR03848 family)